MINKGTPKKKKNANFPASRIKKIMLSNEDIGKITPSTPIVIGKAVDLFLSEILSDIVKNIRNDNNTKITEDDLSAIINKNEKYGFLNIKAPE